MLKKFNWVLVFMVVLAISGCATGRNSQTEIDALNAKTASLQGQLSAKDQEVARLQNLLAQQQMSVSDADASKRLLEEKINSLRASLDDKSSELAQLKASAKKKRAASDDSDLK